MTSGKRGRLPKAFSGVRLPTQKSRPLLCRSTSDMLLGEKNELPSLYFQGFAADQVSPPSSEIEIHFRAGTLASCELLPRMIMAMRPSAASTIREERGAHRAGNEPARVNSSRFYAVAQVFTMTERATQNADHA